MCEGINFLNKKFDYTYNKSLNRGHCIYNIFYLTVVCLSSQSCKKGGCETVFSTVGRNGSRMKPSKYDRFRRSCFYYMVLLDI